MVESMQLFSATPTSRFFGVAEDCCMLSTTVVEEYILTRTVSVSVRADQHTIYDCREEKNKSKVDCTCMHFILCIYMSTERVLKQ